MAQRESKLSRRIIQEINNSGGFAFKVHGGPWMMAGLPDIIACIEGDYYALETKMPTSESNVSPAQQHVHSLIRAAGGEVHIVTSVAGALRVCGLSG